MLRRFTEKNVSPHVDFIPIVYDTLKKEESLINDPSIEYSKAYIKDFKSLPKRKNLFERFRGTWGQTIDTTAY
jgi:hypothetical protein